MEVQVYTYGPGRFVVKHGDSKLYILNEKALKWNLKHVFGQTHQNISSIKKVLDSKGSCAFKAA